MSFTYSLDQLVNGYHTMHETGLSFEQTAEILRGGYGSASTFSISEVDSQGQRRYLSGLQFLSEYDSAQPAPVVERRTDGRKGRQPQYVVQLLGAAGQHQETFVGTLPDCCAWCDKQALKFIPYLKLYRALRDLPVWSAAFPCLSGGYCVFIIAKQSNGIQS